MCYRTMEGSSHITCFTTLSVACPCPYTGPVCSAAVIAVPDSINIISIAVVKVLDLILSFGFDSISIVLLQLTSVCDIYICEDATICEIRYLFPSGRYPEFDYNPVYQIRG
jgi:hypothetical protein